MIFITLLFLIPGLILIKIANWFKASQIEPGFSNFSIVLIWHAFWGTGWGLLLVSIGVFLSGTQIPFIAWFWWVAFLPGFLLFLFGLLPFAFGSILAAAVGFLSNEIGDIKIVNDYFRVVHGIYWNS